MGVGVGRGRVSEGCRNKIQRWMHDLVRELALQVYKIFVIIFLNFEIDCIVPKKLGDILFHIVFPQTMSYIAQM